MYVKRMLFTIKKYLVDIGRLLLMTLVLPIVVWGVGFCLFLAELKYQQVLPEEWRTDAVVVLTGGTKRVEEGIRLMRNGSAGQLLISGVGSGVTLEDLIRLGGLESPEAIRQLRPYITLGYAAGNTAGNAQETSAWVEEHDIRSIRLVTAYYHMPRSRLEFHLMMPEISLLPHPVFPEEAPLFSEEGLRIALLEYHKFIAVLMRQAGVWRAN